MSPVERRRSIALCGSFSGRFKPVTKGEQMETTIEAVRPPQRKPLPHEGSICELHADGDYKTIWNPDKPAEVAAARAAFEDLKSKGYLIYRADPEGEKGEQMRAFEPKASTLIAIPRVVGG